LESINDVVIDGPACPLRLRVYTPQAADDARRPIILFIHGGAAIMGGIESYDGVCRRLATQADAILVSATYRHAPEHKFPAAPDDTWAVLNWVVAQAASLGGDSDKLVIVGESGGGGLAAGCTLRARDEGRPKIAYQILINPALGRGPETDSMRRFGRGFFFEPEALDWILSQVLADPADLADWRASPMLATNLNDLPPTYFVLAGHDILRTDIEQFAERMAASGVDVES
jgi:acetyl esterase